MLRGEERLTEIADDVVTVDNAMKWGYNWELGPFEVWDALGVGAAADRLTKEGREVPAVVRDLLASGKASFYEERETATLLLRRGPARLCRGD